MSRMLTKGWRTRRAKVLPVAVGGFDVRVSVCPFVFFFKSTALSYSYFLTYLSARTGYDPS